MVKRRDFVGGAGAVVAAQLLPGLILPRRALAQSPTRAPNDTAPTAGADLVHVPGGLHGNHNYFFYSGGKPITDLTIEIELTEDLAAETGFSLQLNGWAPGDANSTWQQYCYGFYTEDKARPHLSWSIENWPSNDYRDRLRRAGVPAKDLFNIHGQSVVVPAGIKVAKGYRFKIALLHDPKDSRGAITGAAYTVVDNHGRRIIDDRALIRSYTFSHSKRPIAPEALDPIVTFQLNICKRAGSNYGFMQSGAGTIAYTSAQPLTVLRAHPDGLAAPNTITAEWANTVYSELPAGPAHGFTQTFGTIKAPSFSPGGHLAVSRRSDAEGTSLFAISVSGKLNIFSARHGGRWERSEHGAINMAHPASAIAAARRFGVADQTGAFLVAQSGQLQAFWLGPHGVEGPVAAGAKGLAHPGAAVAAARQFGAHEQTDVFLLDQSGQLNVFWAAGAGPLNGPVKIGPQGFGADHGALTAWQHRGTRRTDVFMIDRLGALSRFWVEGGGHWNGPQTVTKPGFSRPGGHVAAAERPGTSDQTDLFAVDKQGQVQVLALDASGTRSEPVPIGPAGLADAGASLAVAHRADRTLVFLVDRKGTLTAISSADDGKWGAPEQIGQPGAAPSGGSVAASLQSGVADRLDVFVVDRVDAGPGGWPAVTWADERNAWVGPKRIASEV